jgi:hypothetical protein
MPMTLRLNDKEQERLRKRCIELNKRLIMADQIPISDSDLAHFILGEAIGRVETNKNHKLILG